MTGEEHPRVDREGIYIDRHLAEEVAIEEELDSSITGELAFPSPRRRRIAGWIYLGAAVVSLGVIPGGWPVAVAMAVVGAWHFLSAWPLAIDEREAMAVAAAAVEFPVGHASAAVRFRGWRSRPRWSVVMYSATEPPDQRALVVVDAVSGLITEPPYSERLSSS